MSTLRRAGRNIKRTATLPNQSMVYDYVLRCAVRACLEQTQNQRKETKKENRHSSHLSNVGEVLGNFTNQFSEETRPDKISKPLVTGLSTRLDDIKLGKDLSKSEYGDKRFLAVVKQMRDHLKQYKSHPDETINDLVIFFLRAGEAELKKEDPNPAVWFKNLDRFVARFAELVLITVQEDVPASATPEVIESLNRFVSPNKAAKKEQRSSQPTDNVLDTLENFPMIQTVKELFKIPIKEHRDKLRELQNICTEANFFLDLKKVINSVHTNQPYPGRKEDFATQLGYDNWKTRELKQLQELMKSIMLLNPNLSIAATGEQDVGSSNLLSGNRTSTEAPSRSSSELASRNESNYTYIPNDPRLYFRTLMTVCLDHDVNSEDDGDRSKTGILSNSNDELLRECWKTWRLSDPFRAVLYMDLLKGYIDKGALDLDYAKDAMRSLDKCLKENEVANWTINDRENLVRVYEGLNETCLNELKECFASYWKAKPEYVDELTTFLDRIYENPAYLEDHPEPVQHLGVLEETIEGAAVARWRRLEKSLLDPEQDDMTNLMALADKLCAELVNITKKFKHPLQGVLHLPGIVMARQLQFFVLEMDNWAFLPETKNTPIEAAFELYNKVLTLKRLYNQYGPAKKSASFRVESWFLVHVKRWMISTNNATPEWVMNAIKQDEFTPINENTLNSSSVVDLFTIFHQSVDFIRNLQWPNYLQECRFNTALSKVIGIALQQYTTEIDYMIRCDIELSSDHRSGDPASASFFDRARTQLIGGRTQGKLEGEPYNFTKQTCVRINDIEASRMKLDRLYQTMDVDEITYQLREYGTQSTEKLASQQTNYLYSIKIVRAENLLPLDNNGLSDPFVVLEIDGKPVTRTRTCYETLNPRWDQTFDIVLTKEEVVLALVYDEDVIGANDECGSVWFKLAPSYFGDYQTHELKLKIHPQGTLYLRIDMEGEKDDIQYWFAKAFRTLKRAEDDNAGIIVAKMGEYFRTVMNRKTLDKLLGRERSFFSSFYRAPEMVDPALEECEAAITPLLDHLEHNLKTLNDNLTESNMQLIIIRVWKEILMTLEGILLPPLSEQLSELKPLDDIEFQVVYKWLDLLKILFNGGQDGDAVALDKLENSHYYALLAIKAAYNMETDELIEGYNTTLRNQEALKMRGGRKADRSKTVYHSKNTVRKRKASTQKQASSYLPNSDTILRILRMRTGKKVRDFLHAEFEKRNNPTAARVTEELVESEGKDAIPALPTAPTNDLTPDTEQTIPLR